MEQLFGITLREIRRGKNMTQRELAEKAGVDFSYISKVENDRLPPPSADTIIRICEVLQVTPEILLHQSGKVSNEIKDVISGSPEAIRFINEAKAMDLSAQEWKQLTDNLKKLR